MKQILIFLALSCLASSTGQQKRSINIEGYDNLRYSVQQITVAPGTEIELTLKTVSSLPESQMAHNWVLMKKDAEIQRFVNNSIQHRENGYIDPEMTGMILAATSMLGGGESETITFTAPEARGDYIYVCTFPGHYVAGMKGTLTVK